MKRISIIEYFSFGTCVRYLQDIKSGDMIKGQPFVLENIGRFVTTLEELGLVVTLSTRAAFDLKELRKELDKVKDKAATLSEEQAERLQILITDIRKTLEPELLQCEAFIVTPKILDTKKLLDNVDSLLRPNVFSALPDITKYDLMEAGKCIAFERPTAAAFHLLRGTESVLRFFYCTLIHRNRVSPLLWANIVNDLRNRPKSKKHVTLYNNLDNIRWSYRNPTQHPEKIYDIHEVQDLWPLCIEAINRMTQILLAT